MQHELRHDHGKTWSKMAVSREFYRLSNIFKQQGNILK